MTTRALFATVSTVFATVASLLVILPASAQRGQHAGHHARTEPPRANQGQLPPPPLARSDPAEPRVAEHLSTGHSNDTPHVNHNQWFGHDGAHDARFHLDRPFARGRFDHVGPGYRHSILRVDPRLHRFWMPSGVFFDVAAWDWPLCEDWCWSCGDDFVFYDDPDHAGWYLLYNVHTGVFVHCQFMGR
jgi:hypothetical protein